MGELAIINKALESRKIREQQSEDIYKPLAVQIGRIHALRGIKLEVEDLRFMARELTRSVEERFPGLTIEEIGIALDKGIKKDYGEYYGLNVITFLDWIKAYSVSETRSKALLEKYKAALPEKVPPTPEEIKRQKIDSIQSAFEKYEKTGLMPTFYIYSGIVYGYCEEMGLISPGNEEKWSAIRKADEIISREDKKPGERLKKPVGIGAIIKSDQIAPPDVKNKAKAILLERYFAELVKKKIKISDLLKK